LFLSGIGGETNTASNLGLGVGLFKQKVGVDLQFLSLVAGTGIILTSNVNDVTISSSVTGTLINPTDKFIPARSNATSFANSSLFQFDAATIFHINAGVPQFIISTNGGLMSGPSTSNFWGGLPVNGESFIS